MNSYQKEQLEALQIIRSHMAVLKTELLHIIEAPLKEYFLFRSQTDKFLSDHFSRICSLSCYQNRLSACCSKDGIITFFADVVLNTLSSSEAELDRIEAIIKKPNTGYKCVYLAPEGCVWRVKPIVCQMFLCDKAEEDVFGKNPIVQEEWELLKKRKKDFIWPDKIVLFDQIESIFIAAGCSSTLMYLNKSPGLLRIKRQAGLIKK
ncbi:MAG: hypothetical protein FP814_08780 [Desulfobacterium sp.]|nr:hypothetical protein [Desulfobacterium sp.]MBU3947593.1 hypothetical protein [Pseudomonadota bacterium]MBU4037842.1 hypothetical protein [Pseudomonadota bacterium]